MRSSFLVSAALALTVLAGGSSAQTDRPEFRGLWVHTWQAGMLSPEEVQETIRWAKESGMNAVILQARRVGDAYYESAYEPRASNIKGTPDFDPLGYALKLCRDSGLEVYAWFNAYRVWTQPDKPSPAGHILSMHPEWLSRDVNGRTSSADGQFLDPGVPEVRDYLVKLVSDLVGKYDVDGVMLDFVRYPGKTWGYNEKAVARFNLEHGRKGQPSPEDPLWCEWRRRQVTDTVRAIHREIDRVRPGVKLAAATIAWGPCPSDFTKTDAYSHVFQDWRLWMEEGLLDANMPMNYKDPANAKTAGYYVDWLRGLKKWSYGRHVYCGLMVFKDNVGGALSQMKTARELGMDGVVGFGFSQIGCKAALCTNLKTKLFAKAAPPPAMPWKTRVARRGD